MDRTRELSKRRLSAQGLLNVLEPAVADVLLGLASATNVFTDISVRT